MARSSRAFLAVLLAFATTQSPADAGSLASSKRALLTFSSGTSGTDAKESKFAKFVDVVGSILAQALLEDDYGITESVGGSKATLDQFVKQLDTLTAKSSIKAVDCILKHHALGKNIVFADGPKSMSAIHSSIKKNLTSAQRAKLRLMYEVGSYGATHAAGWKDIGFKASVGSKGIAYEDNWTLFTFALEWGSNHTVAATTSDVNFDLANASHDEIEIQMFLKGIGVPNWKETGFKKTVSGSGSLTIATSP